LDVVIEMDVNAGNQNGAEGTQAAKGFVGGLKRAASIMDAPGSHIPATFTPQAASRLPIEIY